MGIQIPKVKEWFVTVSASGADGELTARYRVLAPNKVLARLNLRDEGCYAHVESVSRCVRPIGTHEMVTVVDGFEAQYRVTQAPFCTDRFVVYRKIDGNDSDNNVGPRHTTEDRARAWCLRDAKRIHKNPVFYGAR